MRPILLIALIIFPSVAFGQQSVQVIDSNGNVSTFIVRSYDLTPQIIPIKPYGLNLKPANLPERPRAPVAFDAGAPSGGPLVIENPYFPVSNDFPVVENKPKLENIIICFVSYAIGEFLGRLRLH